MPKTAFPQHKKNSPKVLTFDTSGPFVCVGWATAAQAGGTLLDMPRGQAEALFPTIDDVLAERNLAWADVDVIGVAVGPGNFTGIRISVSAARGLGLALGVPVFALNQFQLSVGTHSPCNTLVCVPAPRDMSYVQGYDADGATLLGQGRLIDPAFPPEDMPLPADMNFHGHRAGELARHFHATAQDTTYAPDPARCAEIARAMYLDATAFPARPAPMYVKPPDAAPARDTAPVILP